MCLIDKCLLISRFLSLSLSSLIFLSEPLDGAPSRDFHLNIPDSELEYAHCVGLTGLRERLADYYNKLYRQGKGSQYTKDNVCIVPGGRAGITRIMAILGTVQIGFLRLIIAC